MGPGWRGALSLALNALEMDAGRLEGWGGGGWRMYQPWQLDYGGEGGERGEPGDLELAGGCVGAVVRAWDAGEGGRIEFWGALGVLRQDGEGFTPPRTYGVVPREGDRVRRAAGGAVGQGEGKGGGGLVVVGLGESADGGGGEWGVIGAVAENQDDGEVMCLCFPGDGCGPPLWLSASCLYRAISGVGERRGCYATIMPSGFTPILAAPLCFRNPSDSASMPPLQDTVSLMQVCAATYECD